MVSLCTLNLIFEAEPGMNVICEGGSESGGGGGGGGGQHTNILTMFLS